MIAVTVPTSKIAFSVENLSLGALSIQEFCVNRIL